jgi:hypothetical protein
MGATGNANAPSLRARAAQAIANQAKMIAIRKLALACIFPLQGPNVGCNEASGP